MSIGISRCLSSFQRSLREAAAAAGEAAQGEDPRDEEDAQPGLRGGLHLLRGRIRAATGEQKAGGGGEVVFDTPTNIGIARCTHSLSVSTLVVVSVGWASSVWVALRFSYH